jgi:hypothetical protein
MMMVLTDDDINDDICGDVYDSGNDNMCMTQCLFPTIHILNYLFYFTVNTHDEILFYNDEIY